MTGPKKLISDEGSEGRLRLEILPKVALDRPFIHTYVCYICILHLHITSRNVSRYSYATKILLFQKEQKLIMMVVSKRTKDNDDCCSL